MHEPCEKYEEMLVLHHYGELGPEDSRELDGHLVTCETCRAALGQIKEGLGSLHAYEPDRGEIHRAVEGVMDRIAARRRVFAGKLVPAMAAAAALALVLLYTLYESPKTAQAPPPEHLMTVVADMELLENYELLRDIDLIEGMDIIEMLDDLEHKEVM